MKYKDLAKNQLQELASKNEGRPGKRSGLGLTRFLACLTSLTLILSACGPQADPQAGGPTKSNQDQNQDQGQTTSSQAKDPGLELPASPAACSYGGNWDYLEPETMPALEGDDVSPAQYEAGYRLDYEMGYSYYLPRAWRDKQIFVRTEYPGNPRFDGEPIYAGRFYYYLDHRQLMELDELEYIDLDPETKAEKEEEILAGQTPLYALILYRNQKLRADLTAIGDPEGFNQRKVIQEYPDLTLVLAKGEYLEDRIEHPFINDYKSLYDSIETIVNSLSHFPPETPETVLQNRASLDFTTSDLEGKSYRGRDLHRSKRNYLLFWSDDLAMLRNYYESFSRLAKAHPKASFLSAIQAGEDLDQAEKNRLLAYQEKVQSDLPTLLNSPSMDQAMTRYISRWPSLLVLDKKGKIIAVHTGVKSEADLADLIE